MVVTGDNLRVARALARVTQGDVAQLLGVSKMLVCRMEARGSRPLTPKHQARIAALVEQANGRSGATVRQAFASGQI